MKIRRFFENSAMDPTERILRDSFYNIIDDMDELVTIEFEKQNNTSWYITITPLLGLSNLLIESIEDIEENIKCMETEILIFRQLKISMERLLNEDIVENYNITKYISKSIKIQLDILTNEDINDFIYVDLDGEIHHDPNRLKKLFKKKFDISVRSSVIAEEYDRNDDRYLEMTIKFEHHQSTSDVNKIVEYLKDLTFQGDYEEDESIFTSIDIEHAWAPGFIVSAESSSITGVYMTINSHCHLN